MSRYTPPNPCTSCAGVSHHSSSILCHPIHVDDEVAKRVRVILDNVRRLGELMVAGFDPHTLQTDLARVGWRLREQLTPQEIERRYFERRYFERRTDEYHAAEHMHFAWAVVE